MAHGLMGQLLALNIEPRMFNAGDQTSDPECLLAVLKWANDHTFPILGAIKPNLIAFREAAIVNKKARMAPASDSQKVSMAH